jgi:hypothetical protein
VPGDHLRALALAAFHRRLPGELERGLVRLRPAGDEVDVRQPLGRAVGQLLGQILGRLIGEEGGVGVGQPVELRLDRLDDVPAAVPQAGDRRAAGGVEVALAVLVDQVRAVAGDGGGIGLAGGTVQGGWNGAGCGSSGSGG